MYKECKTSEHSIQNWMSVSKPFHQSSGIYVEGKEERLLKQEVLGGPKERVSSRNKRADGHMNLQRAVVAYTKVERI